MEIGMARVGVDKAARWTITAFRPKSSQSKLSYFISFLLLSRNDRGF